MPKTVRFYFAYNSPYAFLANTRLARELSPFDVRIDYKPVYSPRAGGGGPDLDSPRIKYIFQDVARFADAYGLAINMGPFADSRRACLGLFVAAERGPDAQRRYHDGVYEARFLTGKDIGDEQTLAAIAENAGVDRKAFLDGLEDPRHAAALDASNADAQADEVFGFPFFVYGDQRFWGNDRIEWLVRELRKG